MDQTTVHQPRTRATESLMTKWEINPYANPPRLCPVLISNHGCSFAQSPSSLLFDAPARAGNIQLRRLGLFKPLRPPTADHRKLIPT